MARHVGAAVASFGAGYLRVRMLRLASSRRPVVALGLVEHLGDIVEAEPIARHVRELYPNGTLLWFARRPFVELVSSYPAVDACVPVPCLTTWILLRASGAFDRIFDMHIQDRVCPACRIPLEKSGVGREVTIQNYYDHGSLLGSQCACAGIAPLTEAPALHIGPRVEERVRELGLPARYLAFHARSNETERDWATEHWVALLEHLVATWKLSIVEVGLRSVLPGPRSDLRIDLCGKLSILETAAAIRSATFFVGVDSGPAHLANAAGVPGLVLLGRWRNFTDHMPFTGLYARDAANSILRAPGPVSELPLAEVIKNVDRRLGALSVAREARVAVKGAAAT